MSPLTLSPRATGPVTHRDGLRASDKGFLNMNLEEYLALLYFTGRKGLPDKRGKITSDHLPALEKLGISSDVWCDLVWNFKKYFGKSRGAGSPDRMREEAILSNRKFQPGQRMVRKCFALQGR
jgi:hypothetical protein